VHCTAIIVTQLGLNLKIRKGAIVGNVVTYVCAKFDDDPLWNEKALADPKSDNNNNNTNKNNNKNNVGVAWGPVPGSNNRLVNKLLKVFSIVKIS